MLACSYWSIRILGMLLSTGTSEIVKYRYQVRTGAGTAKYTNALVGYKLSYFLTMLSIGVSDPTIITVVLAAQTFFPPSMALHSMVGVNCLLSSKVQHNFSYVLMPRSHAHACWLLVLYVSRMFFDVSH